MRIIAATKNDGKIKEIQNILLPYGIEVISQKDADIDVDIDETGNSFEENALIKAGAVAMLCDDPVLADDSGLCIDALDGRPGILSARYGGDVSYNCKIKMLLDEMSTHKNRRARFECVMAIVFPDGTKLTAHGECPGSILTAPKGTGGFGYDPIFYSDELGKSFSECSEEEKNRVSHRGKALKKLCEKIEHTLN